MGNPQWTAPQPDRPEWTEPEPRSWFEKRPPTGETSWRAVSDLTDTAWGANGAWHDPDAPWNVAATGADRDETGRGAADPDRRAAARPIWAGPAGTEHATDPWPIWARSDDPATDRAAADRPAAAATGWAADRPAAATTGWAAADRPAAATTGWAAMEHPDAAPPIWAGTDRPAAGPIWAGADHPATAWARADNPAAAETGWEGRAGTAVGLLERPEEPQPEPGQAAQAGPEPRQPVRHPVRIALFALVLFGLVAGSVAWLSMDKSVTLTVDGEARAVRTYASTVGGVLDDQKITVGPHDSLAPARDARIGDGAEIVLRRGRLVTLTVDGTARQVWTTATTVQEALQQIGYRQDGLWLSANRSTRLPLDGYQLTLRTPKSVTVVVDRQTRRITTTAATVGEALEQAGVRIDGDDRLSPLASAPVRAGMTVTVTRLTTKTTTTRAVLEYKTVEKSDPAADPGSRTVQTKGVTGLVQVTRVDTYVDGKLTSSKITDRTVVKKPVDEVVVVGPEQPAPQPSSAPPPSSAPSQPAECADFPTTGGLNWCGLAKCESGLNPNAYNPAGPYYGLYQFDVQTWQANGGTGTPSGKSIDEQTRVAYNLYQARGRAPWPVCGQYL